MVVLFARPMLSLLFLKPYLSTNLDINENMDSLSKPCGTCSIVVTGKSFCSQSFKALSNQGCKIVGATDHMTYHSTTLHSFLQLKNVVHVPKTNNLISSHKFAKEQNVEVILFSSFRILPPGGGMDKFLNCGCGYEVFLDS